MCVLVHGGKLLAATATMWTTGVSVHIFFSPTLIERHTSTLYHNAAEPILETFSRDISWYEAQGPWGVVVLIVCSAVYFLAARCAWTGRYPALAALSVTAAALSIITGFSIGGLYLPAALALIMATLLFGLSRLQRM